MSRGKPTNQPTKLTSQTNLNPQTNHQKNSKFMTQLDFRGMQLYETSCETRKFVLHCLTPIFQQQLSVLPVVLYILGD